MRRTRRSGRGMLGRSSSRSRTGCLFAGCGSLALGGVCQCQRRRPPVAHTLGPAGTGPRKSHLHGVSVGGGGAPRHPSTQGWGCARRDGPGGMRREGPPYPRPHSPGPDSAVGKTSQLLRILAGQPRSGWAAPRPPEGAPAALPHPRPSPESTQLRRPSGTPGSGGGSEKRPPSAPPQEESLITTGCRPGLFPPLLSVLLPPRNADIFEGYPPPTNVCIRRGQYQPRKLVVYRTPGSTMHPASLCILKIPEPNKAYFLFVLKR